MSISYPQAERILGTYSLEEIYEWNELTEEEVLILLVEHELIELPNPRPVDLEN